MTAHPATPAAERPERAFPAPNSLTGVGVIVVGPGERILLGLSHDGRWELPGGKVEPGESPEQALVRELREELGVETGVLERIPGEWPLKPGHVLQVWTVRLLSGTPSPLQDHDALRWLRPEEADSVDWLVQDRPAVAEAIRRLSALPGPAPHA